MRIKFIDSECKQEARGENIKIYRELAGRCSIPTDKEYWTLCNEQPDNAGAEIVQLVQAGFLTKNQFHGVDWDEKIINQNKSWHPEAHWHHGNWIDVIKSEPFAPAMVYLDTQNVVDREVAANLAADTMILCPPQCLLLVNVMLSNPYIGIGERRLNQEGLTKNIIKKVPPSQLKKWHEVVPCYSYNMTGKTDMLTLAFQKL